MARAFKETSTKAYIASDAFNGDFFIYSTSMNSSFQTVGNLILHPTATPQNCPAGRVLRENGRKLYPTANPGITNFMVGVFDNQSLLSGFIDPNSPVFAVYTTDRPNYLCDSVDPAGGLTDRGPPVLTNGIVSALESVTAGTTVSAGTSITAGTTVRAQKFLTSPVGSGNGTSLAPLRASAGSSGFNGANTASQVIYTTQVTASSLVFVTVNNVGPRAVSAVPNAGYFTVYSSAANDASTFYWLIMN